ncbi:MAG: peptidoglycan-associated lipoprotein Pal [Gammaproteobacteria bacterium]|nr:peptidoglycan-associated lipoprotein Pal [Gammaproteobacteria bacterium]
MSLNALFKAGLLALGMMTLVACESTENVTDAGATTTETVAPAETGPTAAELEEQRLAELRKNHVVYFEFDKTDILPQDEEILRAHGAYLAEKSNVKVLIEGHCDERGTPEYNIALGERRANSVVNYLKGLGVSDAQLSVVSYGEEKPVDPSSNEAAWSKNRRAVLVY